MARELPQHCRDGTFLRVEHCPTLCLTQNPQDEKGHPVESDTPLFAEACPWDLLSEGTKQPDQTNKDIC